MFSPDKIECFGLGLNTHTEGVEMKWMNSDELCRQVASTTADECILYFSRGKDAVGSWLQLRRFFRRIEPVFLYLCPGLQFEEESLQYYERYFGQKIHRLPHPSLYRMLNQGVFQTRWSAEEIAKLDLPYFDYDDVSRILIEDLKLSPITQSAVGIRACDSMNRRTQIKRNGPWHKKTAKFYPIWDWNAEKLRQELRGAKVELPIDYLLFGRSFDGIDARFTRPIRQHAPDDFARLMAFFPLIESDLQRHEFARKHNG